MEAIEVLDGLIEAKEAELEDLRKARDTVARIGGVTTIPSSKPSRRNGRPARGDREGVQTTRRAPRGTLALPGGCGAGPKGCDDDLRTERCGCGFSATRCASHGHGRAKQAVTMHKTRAGH